MSIETSVCVSVQVNCGLYCGVRETVKHITESCENTTVFEGERASKDFEANRM